MPSKKPMLLIVTFFVAPVVPAMHLESCIPESADPSTYNEVTLPMYGTYYIEERPTLDPGAPVPGWGFTSGGATYVYEEANGLPGLQRDSVGLGCLPMERLCITDGNDPIADQSCGHGPDLLIQDLKNPFL